MKRLYIIVGLFFILSAVMKSIYVVDFSISVNTIAFVPTGLTYWLPLAIPLIELWIGFFILIKATRRFGLTFAILLLTVFTVFLTTKAFYPELISCNCFGRPLLQSKTHDYLLSLLKNCVISILSFLSLKEERRI